MRWAKIMAAIGASGMMLKAAPASAQPPRSEVPIREVALSDGTRRYAVPVKIGEAEVTAGLDTGSSGLRVLPGVVGGRDAAANGAPDSYAYGSGARLQGRVGEAKVTLGDVSGRTTLQLVSTVDCGPRKPDCPVSRVPPSQYGIQGDGLPGEGFKAILGINMAQAEVATPLRALGVRRWIVELPRPGEPGPGRLILNPTEAEAAGYALLPVVSRYSGRQGGLHDSVPGCLTNVATGESACASLMLDCGAPGIAVSGTPLHGRPWPDGTAATLSFKDGQGRVAAVETLTIGQRAHASRLTFEPEEPGRGPVVFTGLSPYFAFSVLYDPEHGRVGLKPRDPAPGGPHGQLTAAP